MNVTEKYGPLSYFNDYAVKALDADGNVDAAGFKEFYIENYEQDVQDKDIIIADLTDALKKWNSKNEDNEMNTLKKAEKLIAEASSGDLATLAPGVFLESQKSIIADQEGWGDEDESKDTDFTVCPFWITTDDGQDPEGVRDAEDLAKIIADYEWL